ncbi:hypothetical protein ANN_23409 [Periplaneta americana]|uniref:Uncharacterized protein n=1 Tax=Periplaneta americana TaxID=6978 RepID=A0ABQ8SLG0_PERAM|nr:hypothetical protein ANN_23409 [Periplaneta americana]
MDSPKNLTVRSMSKQSPAYTEPPTPKPQKEARACWCHEIAIGLYTKTDLTNYLCMRDIRGLSPMYIDAGTCEGGRLVPGPRVHLGVILLLAPVMGPDSRGGGGRAVEGCRLLVVCALLTAFAAERILNLNAEQSDGITVFRISPMASLMLHRRRTGAISLHRWWQSPSAAISESDWFLYRAGISRRMTSCTVVSWWLWHYGISQNFASVAQTTTYTVAMTAIDPSSSFVPISLQRDVIVVHRSGEIRNTLNSRCEACDVKQKSVQPHAEEEDAVKAALVSTATLNFIANFMGCTFIVPEAGAV